MKTNLSLRARVVSASAIVAASALAACGGVAASGSTATTTATTAATTSSSTKAGLKTKPFGTLLVFRIIIIFSSREHTRARAAFHDYCYERTKALDVFHFLRTIALAVFHC